LGEQVAAQRLEGGGGRGLVGALQVVQAAGGVAGQGADLGECPPAERDPDR
jgi:hypothetical protein